MKSLLNHYIRISSLILINISIISNFLTPSSVLYGNSNNTHDTTDNTIVRRAIFDIGSVGTKLEVSDINVKNNQIVDTVLFTELPVRYREDLAQQQEPTCFTENTIQAGITALITLKNLALTFNPPPSAYIALATASLRDVPCSTYITQRLSKETGIPVITISQDEEARLGFNGVITQTDHDKHDVVVWELGGGSMQIATLNDQDTLIDYGSFGLVPFKKLIINQVLHQNIHTIKTPNPFTYATAYKAFHLAYILADAVPSVIKNKLADPKTQVIGTGAIVNVVRVAMRTNDLETFSADRIEKALYDYLIGLTDDDLARDPNSGVDRSITITGLILVIGYMRSLGIDEITLIDGGMRQGALLDSRYFADTL